MQLVNDNTDMEIRSPPETFFVSLLGIKLDLVGRGLFRRLYCPEASLGNSLCILVALLGRGFRGTLLVLGNTLELRQKQMAWCGTDGIGGVGMVTWCSIRVQ